MVRANVQSPNHARPAASVHANRSARLRRPGARPSQTKSASPRPLGAGGPPARPKNHAALRLSGSLRLAPGWSVARTGNHGGLQTIKSAWPGGKINIAQLHLRGYAQALHVVLRIGQRPRGIVGGNHRGTPRRASTAASTPVPVPMCPRHGRFLRGGCRQRGLGNQINVFPTYGAEHAGMRPDAVVAAQGLQSGNLHAVFAPLVGAATVALQLTQRDHPCRAIGRAPGLAEAACTSGSAAQGNAVIPDSKE